jgi:ribosomal protein S18 acetylase RimI-like enzyme
MDVTLATAADADAIALVKATGWRTTYSAWVPEAVLAPFLDVRAQADSIAADLAQPPNFALIAREGRVLGIATCLLAGRDEPLLDSLHVLPDARGRGVGSALLDRVAHEVADRGAATLVVDVVEQNVRTRRLYERLGAKYVGTEPAAWAPGVVREAVYRWDDLAELRGGPTAAG